MNLTADKGAVSHDTETGEIFDQPDVNRKAEITGHELTTAVHNMVCELPIWITQDETAAITEKVKRKYATLKAILQVVRPIAMKHGIRIRQGCDHAWQLDTGTTKGRAVPVFTDLIHSATGQFERTTIEIPITRLDAQSMGSAISYGRRYGLLAALGLTTDEADDDGASTKGRDVTEQAEESQLLWEIKAELRDCETIGDLNKWTDRLKTGGRMDKLSEAEAAVLRVLFAEKRKQLEKAADDKGGKGK